MSYVHCQLISVMLTRRNAILGNTLPVPMNICPSPRSIVKCLHRIKQLLSWKKSHDKKHSKLAKDNLQPEHSIRIGLGRTQNSLKSKTFTSISTANEKILNQQPKDSSSSTLTYQIVIERVVKRFLLYYQNNHHGSDELKDSFEFKEIKQDISSFRFELSHEIDRLDETCNSLVHTMNIFKQHLHDTFPIEQIKSRLERDVKS
jgi:hypothetical protein